jgi:hypothetical protein
MEDGRVSIDDVIFRVRDPAGKNLQISHNTIEDVYGESINSENDVVFCDRDLDGKLTPGDYFTIKSASDVGEHDGKFILIFRPTREILAEVTFP